MFQEQGTSRLQQASLLHSEILKEKRLKGLSTLGHQETRKQLRNEIVENLTLRKKKERAFTKFIAAVEARQMLTTLVL